MIPRIRLTFLLAVIGLALLGFGVAPAFGGHARAAVPLAPVRAAVLVTIQNFAFSPAIITVAPGTVVTWTNKDSAAHTVTSKTNAWPDSGNLDTGKSFSHTFDKPGSYAYYCAIHPNMTATVVVSGSGASGSGSPAMPSMGPMSKTSTTAFTGYYDGHTVLFLSTDSSSKAEAQRNHINYAPLLAASLRSSIPMYLVMNGKYAGRGAVFGSQPGEANYTPLWQEVYVTWKNPGQAVALGRDDQIKELARSGKLTLKMTGIVLNAPIIKVMS